jgi:hypothetical protein
MSPLFSFRASSDLLEVVRQTAARRGVSASRLIREAVRRDIAAAARKGLEKKAR